MSWTKELPKEEGHYWYREDKLDEPQVIYYSTIMKSINSCGTDVPLASWMDKDNQIIGEFYTEKLTPPAE